jgi:hypothetical protein
LSPLQYACLREVPMTIEDNEAEQMLDSVFPNGQPYSVCMPLLVRKSMDDDM